MCVCVRHGFSSSQERKARNWPKSFGGMVLIHAQTQGKWTEMVSMGSPERQCLEVDTTLATPRSPVDGGGTGNRPLDFPS
jgi:hypothetical protein